MTNDNEHQDHAHPNPASRAILVVGAVVWVATVAMLVARVVAP
ncbi:hypothetical protein [Streptomyces sp. NBC_01207]|nr:hypothetical protein OG457_26510 [Streptomyces sp. NBC_01207]